MELTRLSRSQLYPPHWYATSSISRSTAKNDCQESAWIFVFHIPGTTLTLLLLPIVKGTRTTGRRAFKGLGREATAMTVLGLELWELNAFVINMKWSSRAADQKKNLV